MMDLMRLSALLLIVGGLNWGSVGAFGKDLVAGLLGARSMAARAVYIAVGLAAVYVAANYFGVLEGFEPRQYSDMTADEQKIFCRKMPNDSNCKTTA